MDVAGGDRGDAGACSGCEQRQIVLAGRLRLTRKARGHSAVGKVVGARQIAGAEQLVMRVVGTGEMKRRRGQRNVQVIRIAGNWTCYQNISANTGVLKH